MDATTVVLVHVSINAKRHVMVIAKKVVLHLVKTAVCTQLLASLPTNHPQTITNPVAMIVLVDAKTVAVLVVETLVQEAVEVIAAGIAKLTVLVVALPRVKGLVLLHVKEIV
ncbi:MAG: hypothetical protein IJ622_06340 [Bacteroidales bacterium]|nr:hypothetical protein [Bacteroidales bacterium]